MLPNPFDDKPSHVATKAAMTYAFLIAANIAAWVWARVAFADRPVLLGTAFLAYMFGLRHAFDADHIAAIDNVVRKLMQEGKSPFSVGFFFSLGHSSIVVLASIAIAATAATMQSKLDEFHDTGGVIGTTVSAAFLLLIGLANLFVLKGIWSALNRARRGEKIVDEDLDALLAGRGLIARFSGWFLVPGICIRSASCLAWASTRRRKSVWSAYRQHRQRKACPSGRSWFSPPYLQQACR
jgi:high-affinity nickel-transport protein